MSKYMQCLKVALLLIFLLLLTVKPAGANPYESYIYDFWGQPVTSPQAYLPYRLIDGDKLGIGSLNSPQDVVVANDDRIYILDTGNSRIICLDKNWDVLKVIDSFIIDGQVETFDKPTGFFVTDGGHIYVADRNNGRIIELDQRGEFVRQIGPPRADVEGVVREDLQYLPVDVVVDRAGRIYVLAEGVYEGIIEFDVGGIFRGFIGAPRVRPSIADIAWKRIATREQRLRMALFLPTEYSGIDLDYRGFIFATEATGVKRLNPTGLDVLRRTGFAEPIGDVPVYYEREGEAEWERASRFVDIVARDLGVYSVLDQRRGRVFTYDEEGNLLYVFGGLGFVRGLFRMPVALETIGEYMVVLDSRLNRLTIFKPTVYAQNIHSAIKYHQMGRYEDATRKWIQVLGQNINFDLAYSGIGRAMLEQGQYSEAMHNFQLGHNRREYSEAFTMYRRDLIRRNFGNAAILLVIVIVLKALIRKFKPYSRLKHILAPKSGSIIGQMATEQKLGFIYDLGGSGDIAIEQTVAVHKGLLRGIAGLFDSLRYSLHVIFHPFDGFWDLKHEKRGSILSAAAILLLLALTYVIMRQYTGFIFNLRDLAELNIVIELLSVIVPFFLWCTVNWSLTTLTEGKGKFKDIVITTAFALTPFVLINIPLTIVSNFIRMEEGAFYHFFLILSMVWSGGLLFFGTMVVHDYDMSKTFSTVILTVVGMGVVIFIGLLFLSVINLMVSFIVSIYQEMTLRL